jgi:hypothetical protein
MFTNCCLHPPPRKRIAKECGAGIPISEVLKKLYEANNIHGARIQLPYMAQKLSHLKEQDKLKASLELVGAVITDELWDKLCTQGLEEGEVVDLMRQIETSCLTKLRSWEEASGIGKPLINQNRARAKPFYVGLGRRVVKYKSATQIQSLHALCHQDLRQEHICFETYCSSRHYDSSFSSYLQLQRPPVSPFHFPC